MKILLVTHAYPPHSLGGVETYTQSLARALRRAGAEPVVLARRDATSDEAEGQVRETRDGDLRVLWMTRPMDRASSFEGLYASAAVDSAFGRLLEAEAPAVVHFMHLTCLSTGMPQVAKSQGRRLLYTLHDYWPQCARGQLLQPDGHRCEGPDERRCARCVAPWLALGPGRRRAQRRLQRLGVTGQPLLAAALGRLNRGASLAQRDAGMRTLRKRQTAITEALGAADLLLSPSEDLAERYRRNVPELGPIRISPYGFDLEALADGWRPRPGAPPLRIGLLGSLMPSKGTEVAVEAMKGLPAAEFQLSIFGRFPEAATPPGYVERVRRMARRGPVRFEEPFEPSQRAAVYRDLDLLLVPSVWWENAPLTMQEAAAAGVPVLASGIGGMAELLGHGVAGWRFPPGNADALRAMLRMVQRHPEDLRRKSREARPPRSIADDAAGHLEIYRELGAA